MQVPAEHCGRFWYQVWFQLDPVTFERKIPADDFGRLYRIINFQLEFLVEISIPEDVEDFKECCISIWIFEI